jgi:hypothetical protein
MDQEIQVIARYISGFSFVLRSLDNKTFYAIFAIFFRRLQNAYFVTVVEIIHQPKSRSYIH